MGFFLVLLIILCIVNFFSLFSENGEQKKTELTPEQLEKIEEAEFKKKMKRKIYRTLFNLEKLMDDKDVSIESYERLKKGFCDLYEVLSNSEKNEYQDYKNSCKRKVHNYVEYNSYEDEESYEEENVVSKKQSNNSSYYDNPYDIDFEDDSYTRTEKIFALHEETPNELDDYYDDEYTDGLL